MQKKTQKPQPLQQSQQSHHYASRMLEQDPQGPLRRSRQAALLRRCQERQRPQSTCCSLCRCSVRLARPVGGWAKCVAV